jgi:hypothetical protein
LSGRSNAIFAQFSIPSMMAGEGSVDFVSSTVEDGPVVQQLQTAQATKSVTVANHATTGNKGRVDDVSEDSTKSS